MNQEMQTVHTALKYLAAQCNYAATWDSRGYNKLDADFGHSLAARETLSYNMATCALKMLRKYTKQLAAGGISLPDSVPPPVATNSMQSNGSGKISLKDNTVQIRFPSIPSQADRDFIKSIRGWRYDGISKLWSVPASHLDAIIAKFPSLSVDPAIAAEREALQEKEEIEQKRQQQITDTLLAAIDLDADFSGKKLFRHQQEAIRILLEKRRMILADDMGLGKTLSALVAARAWQKAYNLPVFVICPASLQDNWKREAAAVQVEIEVFSWAKIPQSPETDYIMIADESHYAQNLKSQRTQAMLALATSEYCQASYLLTGTPIKNGRPANLFPLLCAVRHPLSRDRKHYEIRYCNAHATRFTRWDTTGATNLKELHTKTQDSMLRRTKAECLDLPAKLRTLRKVEMSTEARSLYNQTLAELRAEYHARLKKGEILSGGEALVILTHLRHSGSIAKVESAIEIVEEILEQGHSVVLFVEFAESAKQIAEKLSSYGVEMLIGETPSSDRQAMVDRFQSGNSRVFISTTKAGGVGITLTAASDVILVDRPWTPADTIQAEDRCHRIGQSNCVNVQWLQANGTDEKIDAIIMEKARNSEMILQGKEVEIEAIDYAAIAHEVFA